MYRTTGSFFQDSVQAARTENNDLTKTYVYGVLKLKWNSG